MATGKEPRDEAAQLQLEAHVAYEKLGKAAASGATKEQLETLNGNDHQEARASDREECGVIALPAIEACC
ncbi:MAG: hypothetical protein ACYDDA_12155 [Acidiferrobacteraceae bacterium]